MSIIIIVVTVVLCALKQCPCNREGSEVGTLRPGKGRSGLPCNRVRPSADTPCSRSLPICGRIGVSLSILCSGLLPSGGTSQTNMVLARPCTDPYCSRARVRVGASVCGSLTTCRWTTLQHDRFANSLRPQFLTHANDPNVAWYTLRSAALRLLPLVMFPRCVPNGRAWRCVSTFLSNRAKTLPVLCGKPLARLS